MTEDDADFVLRFPYPPSVNDIYGHKAVRRKQDGKLTVIKYLLEKVRDYRKTVCEMVFEQIGEPPKLKDRLACVIRLFPRDSRDDIDNAMKSLLDAMEYSQVYINDRQIDQLLIVRKRRARPARVEVLIKTL